jgi:hypothetical protein
MKDTSCFRLKFRGKISYFDCHRCFLPLDHPFRLDSDIFKKSNIVLEGPLRCLSSPAIADILDNLVLKENGDEFVEYGKDHNWTHKYALWELPYAKALILMHNIDVMHQECNVGESILSTCMAQGGGRGMRRRRRGMTTGWGWTMRGWGDVSASRSASSYRFRSSHLVCPLVVPRDDNRVVIVPCGDG